MSTKVYGSSDDLIEFEGDFTGEVGHYGTNEDKAVLVVMSDGTILKVWYGKDNRGIWVLQALRKGNLFVGIDQCDSEDADPYSDVANFKCGIKWAYVASEWEQVK